MGWRSSRLRIVARYLIQLMCAGVRVHGDVNLYGIIINQRKRGVSRINAPNCMSEIFSTQSLDVATPISWTALLLSGMFRYIALSYLWYTDPTCKLDSRFFYVLRQV